MLAPVYASALAFALIAPTITPLGWNVLGCLALLTIAYLVFAEWQLRRTFK